MTSSDDTTSAKPQEISAAQVKELLNIEPLPTSASGVEAEKLLKETQLELFSPLAYEDFRAKVRRQILLSYGTPELERR